MTGALLGRAAALLFPVVFMCAMPRPSLAQDKFEIEVYRYQTAARGEWELETHLNFAGHGTTAYDGTVAPTDRQLRFAAELTRGITDHWEVSAYLLAARRPDAGVEYAGWRLRTRVRAPENWRLPINVGVNAEWEATRLLYGESPQTLEITPVFETTIGRLQLNFDPSFERDFSGPSSREGWEVEPKVRVAFGVSRTVGLGVEYFGSVGHFGDLFPAGEQVHQFYPSVDLKLGDDFSMNFAFGLGSTSNGDRLVFKSRFEFPLGGEKH